MQRLKRLAFKPDFNSRAYTRRDDFDYTDTVEIGEFQFTRLYKARLVKIGRAEAGSAISIHAPIQGATSSVGLAILTAHISIHAPIQGATLSARSSLVASSISIHAPIQGATYYAVLSSRRLVEFQFTRLYKARQGVIK